MKLLIVVMCLAAGSLADTVNVRHTLVGSIPVGRKVNVPVDQSDNPPIQCLYCFEVAVTASKSTGTQKISIEPPTTKTKFAFLGLHNCVVAKSVKYDPAVEISTANLSIDGLNTAASILQKIGNLRLSNGENADLKQKVASMLADIKALTGNINGATTTKLPDLIKNIIETCFKYANLVADSDKNGAGWANFPFKFITPSFKKSEDSELKNALATSNTAGRSIDVGTVIRKTANVKDFEAKVFLYLGQKNPGYRPEDIRDMVNQIGCNGADGVQGDVRNYIYLEKQ